MSVPRADDPWALELAKARQAAGPEAASGPAGRYWPAALLGLALAVKDVLLTRKGDRLPAGAPAVAGVHGEVSNRTRHILTRIAQEAPQVPILLLGRPRMPLPLVRAEFARLGVRGARLTRPYGIAALLAALSAIRWRLGQGAVAVARADWLPPARELAAIAYRVTLGEVSACWAEARAGEGRLRPRVVVLGHTGTAEVDGLERALQGLGARTLHWVHGVSQGLNFHAGSSVGLFSCAADARWHAALGGYGRAEALIAERPAPPEGGEGWLLLSNLIHPMNPDYRANGIAGEASLLALVSEAADLAGVARERVVWKPHPVLATLGPEVQGGIVAEARRLGLSVWPYPPLAGLAPAAGFSLVLTTPSTAAIDVLALGRLPILVGAQTGIAPDSAIAQFPLKAETAAEIAAAVERVGDPGLFEEAWERVGPGRPPTWAELVGLVER